jgi:Putative zinc-finger
MSSPLLRCREVRPYLSAYVDGELDEGLQERIEAHLASCQACSRQVESYRAIEGLLSSLPASGPPPEVLDRVLAATSRQNSERAVRQSLRRPEKPVAPRLLPAFLIADTNLAAPISRLRNLGARRRGSWIMVTALPTLAALLLVAVTFISFHAQRHLDAKTATTVPTVSKVAQMYKTDEKVADVMSQLPFNPQMPTDYPRGMQYQRVGVGTYSNGAKYLDVFWTLAPPFTTLHLREAGLPLAERANLDDVGAESNPLQTWQIPGYSQWQNMSDMVNSGVLVEGVDKFVNFGFSATLDIGLRGGNLTPYSQSYRSAVTILRLVSLSIDQQFTPLGAVGAPNAAQVVHFKMLTTGESDGKTYEWEVYWDNLKHLARATLSNSSSGAQLYTDYWNYWNGVQVTRCEPQGICEDISSEPSLFATDPSRLSGSVTNFLDYKIIPDLLDGELWNTSMIPAPAPSSLGIGNELVYTLAFDDGLYPMSVFVSAATKQVVGITSEVGEQYAPPGGKDAAYPLVGVVPTGGCSPVGYTLIVYLPDNAQNLKAPPSSSGGKVSHFQTVATCIQG